MSDSNLRTDLRQHSRDMFTIASTLGWDLNALRNLLPAEVNFMAEAIRDAMGGDSLRPEGQPLDLASMTDEEIYDLARKAAEDPASITLNGIRLLSQYVLSHQEI